MKAILIDRNDGRYAVELGTTSLDAWPVGDVVIRIAYSTLNYKDALAVTGKAPVVRRFPMIPGIDLAGTVETSEDPRFAAGDAVLLNGWGVGETHPGGLAERARVKADWLQRLPHGITLRQAMAIGTAGYTAMLCILALERRGVRPVDGPILVTGAAGGVGSVAIPLLAKAGYTVVAASGRPELQDELKALGASRVLARQELLQPGKPLQAEQWAGAVDVVGGQILANVCAQLRYGGAVAACGLAGGSDLPATVLPFILRGVALLGIDSVMCPMAQRMEAWERLARDVDLSQLEGLCEEIPLEAVHARAEDMLAGRVKGRVVVRIA